VVIRDVTQAVILSSSGFILGPFVYFGHEKAWEYFSNAPEPRQSADDGSRLIAVEGVQR
jgi:hypothetical protein